MEPNRQGPAYSRGFRYTAWSLLATLLVLPLLTLSNVPGDTFVAYVHNILLTLVPVGAALSCWRAARRVSTERLQTAWILMGLACLLWAIGQMASNAIETFLHQEPFPSPADIGYTAFALLCVASLAAFIGFSRTNLVSVRTLFDGLILATATLFVAWVLVLGDLFATAQVSQTAGILAIGYPMADLAILTVAALILGRSTREFRDMFGLMAAGLLAITAADFGFAYLSLRTGYLLGELVNLGWIVGFGVIGLSALHPWVGAAPPSTSEWRPTRAGSVLPYAALLTVILAGSVEQATTGALGAFLVWTGISFVLFVGGRQVLLGIDNVRLSRRDQENITRLRHLEEQRVRIFNAITHDLGNPVNPIKIQAAILRMDDLSAQQRHSVDVIDRNARLLERLIGDIRDLAKVEARKLVRDLEPTDIDALISETVESFRPEATERGVELVFQGSGARVAADAERLMQVTHNLVSNALKFTSRGGRVSVTTRAEGERVFVEVQDTGRGLSPEEAGRLFQPFVQVHTRGEIPERGTGLGLYISRSIVEAHGGAISVRSDGRGHGSTFHVELPKAA